MKIKVKVSAGSKNASVVVTPEGIVKVRVNAPARKGKANKRLIEILAAHYGVSKKDVKITHGLTDAVKLIEINSG
ncbi:MAG: hypothetical protein COT16_02825 [Elusimicrobia bacterium CG08_land_8_20_14_0_20_44_26]|nr:MAG: hypothetical protein COT16_02825 [Elusimicrobia bacterium CG08_land_8_20_14_0_20_44_26]